MPRFIACSILCRCSWQYNVALLLRRHSTAKPNSKPSATFTIDMVSLKFLQHHKHCYSKKYQYLRNCKKTMFLSRKFAITPSTKALRGYFALPESPPTSATLVQCRCCTNYIQLYFISNINHQRIVTRFQHNIFLSSTLEFDVSV